MNWNVAGTVFQSVTRIASPKLHLLISYLLEDEFSFFSPYWINITIFICTPRISVEAHALSILLSLSRYLLMALRNFKVAASKKLLPRSTTSYSFWLSLSSCSYINFPNVQVTVIAACFMCPVTSFRFYRLKMECQTATKNAANFLWATCESFKNLLFHQSSILVASRKCDMRIEKWAYKKPDKSGHAFAEKQRNPRSFNSIFLFTMIIFGWIFFKDTNSVIFRVDFFSLKFEHISWNYWN